MPGADLSVAGRALFPGVPLQISLHPEGPSGGSIRLTLTHEGRPFLDAPHPAAPGATLCLETPYPYEDLVPGLYEVSVELVDASGVVLERHPVGGYGLTPHWFSA